MDRRATLRMELQRVLGGQRYLVLATESGGQPYTNLMAFAVSDDLCFLTLLTDRRTRKFATLTANRRVALFFDDRENVGTDTRDALAVTAIGEAEEVAGSEAARLRAAFTARHPTLADFAQAPDCAVVRVRVGVYHVVSHFEEVREWYPGAAGQ